MGASRGAEELGLVVEGKRQGDEEDIGLAVGWDRLLFASGS